jgi:putative hydrolase of the HAD superfamily
MVGNSVKSDILPVLALGAHAVHVPHHLTWVLEQVDQHEEEFAELGSIADLPNWLGLLSAPTPN